MQAWYVAETVNPRDHSDMCHCKAAPYCLLWSLFINLAISKQPWAIPIKVGFSTSWSVLCATRDLECFVLIVSTFSNESSKSDLACNSHWSSERKNLFVLSKCDCFCIATLYTPRINCESFCITTPSRLGSQLHRNSFASRLSTSWFFFLHRNFIANLFVSLLDRSPDHDSSKTHKNNIRLYEFELKIDRG